VHGLVKERERSWMRIACGSWRRKLREKGGLLSSAQVESTGKADDRREEK